MTTTMRRAAVQRFFAWWRNELVASVPPAVRRWWRGDDREIVGRIDEQAITLRRESDGALRDWVRCDGTDVATRHAQLDRALAGREAQGARLVVLLDAAQVLVRRVHLPLAVEENLRQALGFEIDRLTPFRAEQVYFDHTVVDRDVNGRRLDVQLAVVRRTVVDAAIAHAASGGFAATGATVVLEGGTRMRFGPMDAHRHRPGHLGRRARFAWLSAAIVLALVWLGLPIWQKWDAASRLAPLVAAARAEAGDVAARRDELDHVVAAGNWLPDRRWQRPSTLVVLDELTKRLGNDTFVTIFEFDSNGMQIQGESSSAPGLVELLDKSAVFKDVTFKSQLTKIAGGNTDRFHLAAAFEDAARLGPPAAEPPRPERAEPTP